MQVTMFLCQYAEERDGGAAFNAIGGGLSEAVVGRTLHDWFTIYCVAQIVAEVGDSGPHVARLDLLDADGCEIDKVIEADFEFAETESPRATLVRPMRDWKLGRYTDVRLSIDGSRRAECAINFTRGK